MTKTTVTFRLDAKKRAQLDAIADGMDRDRSYVLTEAVDAYLDVHQWQAEHIRKGLSEARAGRFATDAEVKRTFARLRKK
ncbi:MAG TPA: CopG family transcriptional regulator [Methylomirabilota bacterium]|nr:CopG family transcriptional regulator [Methylomirabilota bacterium]